MFQDLRYGVRILMKSKGVTFAAVLCLALGIGANTTILSLASALFMRPLPVPNPDQLVTIIRGRRPSSFSYRDFVTMRERNEVLSVFSGFAAHSVDEFSFGNGSRSEIIPGEMVSGNYFEVLGVQPALGRAFLPEEERAPGAPPVVMLSHSFWESRFNRDPQVVGQTITLNGHRFTVIGIAAAGFTGTLAPFAANVWVLSRQTWYGLGRLKPGVSLAQAQAALETLNRQFEQAAPPQANQQPNANEASRADRSLKLHRLQGIHPELQPMAKTATTLLAAAAGLVLLIACATVANLLLARGGARRKEIAIRLALGASRWRLAQQLLTESALLALMGASAGLLLAFWINQLLMAFKPPFLGAWDFTVELRLNTPVLGLTLLLALVTSLVFGLAPALLASKSDVVPALKDETGTADRDGRFSLRNVLVVVQLALSLVLLIGAGLFIRSLQHLRRIDPGFKTENLLAISFNLRLHGYDDRRGKEFARQLDERISALPGVQSASVADYAPLRLFPDGVPVKNEDPVEVEGRESPPHAPRMVALQAVGLRYFETLGVPLVSGRDFTAQDTAAAPAVAIINETMARRFFPGEDPLGKRLRIGGKDPAPCEIVGVVKNTLIQFLAEAPEAVTYRPFAQHLLQRMSLIARATGDPHALIPSVRREIQTLDDNLPVQEIKTLDELAGFHLWPTRIGASLLGGFGLLGLLLAAVGVYGVISYSMTRRTREIGVRMALGAQPRDVLKLIVRQGMTLTLIGVAIGVALAWAATRLLASVLYGVSATDLPAFVGAPIFLIGVALFACYLPARSAMRIDPTMALRHD